MAVLPCLPRGHRRDFSPKREKSADPYAQSSRPSTSTSFRTVCKGFAAFRTDLAPGRLVGHEALTILIVRRLGGRDGRGILLPDDRDRLAYEGVRQHLLHARDGHDLQAVLHRTRNVRQVLDVLFRDQNLLDSPAQRSEELLL